MTICFKWKFKVLKLIIFWKKIRLIIKIVILLLEKYGLILIKIKLIKLGCEKLLLFFC
jgi:hypothetical protein